MLKNLTVGCAGVVVLAFAGVTQADTIGMRFDGITGQSTGFSYTSGARTSDFGGSTTAGKFAWTVTTGGTYGSHTFGTGATFFTFCTELTQFISPGTTYTYDLVSPSTLPTPPGGIPGFTMGSFRAGLLAEFFQNNFKTATTGTTLQAAAFQMGVWEIVYQDDTAAAGDGTFDSLGEITLNTLSGIFSMDNASAGGVANGWLSSLMGTYSADPDWLVGFGSSTTQDQATLIPLPPPVWLAAVGLVGVVVGRRRLGRVAV